MNFSVVDTALLCKVIHCTYGAARRNTTSPVSGTRPTACSYLGMLSILLELLSSLSFFELK